MMRHGTKGQNIALIQALQVQAVVHRREVQVVRPHQVLVQVVQVHHQFQAAVHQVLHRVQAEIEPSVQALTMDFFKGGFYGRHN